MQTYTARRFHTEPEKIEVSSKRCPYIVTFDGGDIFLEGPGVKESCFDDLEFDSLEDAAIYYVLLFENGLWPEE